MDALDVIINKESISPFFQPIISADTQLIIGYEVFGRIESNGEMKSLRWFFQDHSIPEEYRQEVDLHIYKLALDRWMKYGQGELLFLNLNTMSLLGNEGEDLLQLFQSYEKEGLDLSKVVLEIHEHENFSELSQFKHFLTYLQSLHFQIAMEVKISGSYLDRMIQIKPNILKVNLDFLEEITVPQLYRDVLYSLSLFSSKIGATLMFEGINSFIQLNYAWRYGGRYYQGNYLARPKSQFVSLDFSKENLKKDFQHFIELERNKIEAQFHLTEKLEQILKNVMKKINRNNDLDQIVLMIARELGNMTFRVYICNALGEQQSGNAIKNEEGLWEIEENSRYKNWSWRPYFLENIARMNYEKRGILSDIYTDIRTDEIIRTYSIPFQENLYIFVDIPYMYLYENDGLL